MIQCDLHLLPSHAVYQIIILAVVQGIAEFLPISSSGHLVILGALMGELSESPTLEVILHAGTLGSILVVFWRRILKLITSDQRVIPLLVVGTIPAGVIGVTIKVAFPHLLRSPLLAATMLLVTGTMLIVLGRLKTGDRSYQSLSWLGAFLVGCFQAVAILPGISRSGSTILGGRLMGLKNDDSVNVLVSVGDSSNTGCHRADHVRPLGRSTSRIADCAFADGVDHRCGHLVCSRDCITALADRLESPRPAPLVCLVVHSGGVVGDRSLWDGVCSFPPIIVMDTCLACVRIRQT